MFKQNVTPTSHIPGSTNQTSAIEYTFISAVICTFW